MEPKRQDERNMTNTTDKENPSTTTKKNVEVRAGAISKDNTTVTAVTDPEARQLISQLTDQVTSLQTKVNELDASTHRHDELLSKSLKSVKRMKEVTVQEGENIQGIARRELGNAGHWKDILACNPGLTTTPAAGTVLQVPTNG